LFSGGRILERLAGRSYFLATFLGSGLLAGVAGLAVYPFVVFLGANAAVLGVHGVLCGITSRRSETVAPWMLSRNAYLLLAYAYAAYAMRLYGPAGAVHSVIGLTVGVLAGLATPIDEIGRIRFPARRAVATVFVATVLVAALAVVVPRVEDAAPRLRRYTEIEGPSIRLLNDALGRWREHQLSDESFAEVVQHDLLPAVRAEREAFLALRTLSPAQQATVGSVLRIVDLRREGLELLLKGLEQKDVEYIRQWQQHEDQIRQIVEQLKAATGGSE